MSSSIISCIVWSSEYILDFVNYLNFSQSEGKLAAAIHSAASPVSAVKSQSNIVHYQFVLVLYKVTQCITKELLNKER